MRISSGADFPESKLANIAHFFEHYQDLEPGKWVKLDGWAGLNEAREEIISSIERCNSAKKKLYF